MSGERVEEWYTSYAGSLKAYAMRYVHDTHTAEEVVQDAFVTCVEHASTIRQPRAWLYRTVHNKCVDITRTIEHNRVFPSGDTLDTHRAHNTPDLATRVADRDHFTTGLNKLTSADKNILLQYAELDRSPRALAREYDISISAAKIRVYRARRRLRDAFERLKS